jgi:acetyltransferase-like isoleucine patch superfamily enzyme
MGLFEEISVKIRRRETPFFDRIYRTAKSIRLFEVPVIPVFHSLLWYIRIACISFFSGLLRVFYCTPVFKTRCAKVGKGLHLIGGIPMVYGNLTVIIGDNVTIHGASGFNGAKVFDKPTLTIGNNTHLGYQVGIRVGCNVEIGKDVMIGNGVSIVSYDGHSTKPELRHLTAPKETSKPIVIKDNVWIGARAIILKGVTIGEGSVVSTGSVVTGKVPPNSLVIGNPARVFPLM